MDQARAKGAKYYEAGRYFEAVRAYSEGLDACGFGQGKFAVAGAAAVFGRTAASLLGNRSAALMMVCRFADCVRDCTHALAVAGAGGDRAATARLLARGARALTRLGRFEESETWFRRCKIRCDGEKARDEAMDGAAAARKHAKALDRATRTLRDIDSHATTRGAARGSERRDENFNARGRRTRCPETTAPRADDPSQHRRCDRGGCPARPGSSPTVAQPRRLDPRRWCEDALGELDKVLADAGACVAARELKMAALGRLKRWDEAVAFGGDPRGTRPPVRDVPTKLRNARSQSHRSRFG